MPNGASRVYRGRPVAAAAWLSVAAILTVSAVAGLIYVANVLQAPDIPVSVDPRPTLLCVSLIGLNCITYIGWPSRWNIVAHGQLAFSAVAYVIPIAFLHVLTRLSSRALNTYVEIVVTGFGCCLFGALVGVLAAGNAGVALADRAKFTSVAIMYKIRKRILVIAILSILAVLTSFTVMGFAPALTSDPLTAKFFRGPYAAPYAPVAPLYRAGTTIISLTLPLLAVLAWRRRTLWWHATFIGALIVMILGLQRTPAVTGLLLAIGIAFAVKGKPVKVYLLLLLATYMVGGALYSILDLVGLGSFSVSAAGPHASFLQRVAAGAPDISDQVQFVRSFLDHGVQTHGLTFVGGLRPGNYKWNPAVFSLRTVNPGVNVSQIQSGGLRLPAPIWGFASFGWFGVVWVSFLYGAISGFLARLFARVTPSSSAIISACWIVTYSASLAVFPLFFQLSYLTVLELVAVWLLLFWRTGRHAASPPRSGPLLANASRSRVAQSSVVATLERRATSL